MSIVLLMSMLIERSRGHLDPFDKRLTARECIPGIVNLLSDLGLDLGLGGAHLCSSSLDYA